MVLAVEFAQPERLAFLLLLPILYLLSRPPRPRQTRATAHLDQWLAARRKLSRRPIRFRWLRFLLLAGAFLGAVLANMGPTEPGVAGPTQLVILLDVSASMGATAPGATPAQPDRTAFDAAKAAVLAVLEETPAHVSVRLGLCAQGVTVVKGSRVELRAALSRTEPAGVGMVDFESLARELGTADTVVLTVTDGLGSTGAPKSGALRRVGGPAPNVAITKLAVEDAWPLPEVEIRLRIENWAEQVRFAELRVEGALDRPLIRTVRLEPGTGQDLALPARRGSGGELTVRLRDATPAGSVPPPMPFDLLPLDDAVAVVLPAPPEPEIALRSSTGVASDALRAAAETMANECGGKVVSGTGSGRIGFLLTDGGSLPAPKVPAPKIPAPKVPAPKVPAPKNPAPKVVEGAPAARMVTFGTSIGRPPGQPIAWSPGEVRVVEWNRTHPITAGLDLSELKVRRALAWEDRELRAGDQVLIFGDAGPLAICRPGDGSATVHLAFRLGDTNFGSLTAFPQFLRRCLAAAYGGEAKPVILTGALLDSGESRLRLPMSSVPPGDRPVPAFATEAREFAVPILCLALLLLAIRVYV